MRALAEAECLPLPVLSAQRPELQLATLTVAAARREGLESAYGSEFALSAQAERHGLRKHSLENAQEQIKAILTDDPAELAELIESGQSDLQNGQARRVIRELTDVWARGDLARLQTYADWCECADTPAERRMLDRILRQRNRVLAERMDALHAQNAPVFFAVGALHMVSPEGLPDLLKARGYRVTRMF